MIIHKPVNDVKDEQVIFRTYLRLQNFIQVNNSSKPVKSELFNGTDHSFQFMFEPNAEKISIIIIAYNIITAFPAECSAWIYILKDRKRILLKKNDGSFTERLNKKTIELCTMDKFDKNWLNNNELIFFIEIKYRRTLNTSSKTSIKIPINDCTVQQGIENEDKCCFMNSVFQLFYHIPEIRKFVYNLDTKKERFYLNLQILFCWLQISTSPASMKAMIQTLGNQVSDCDAFCFYLFLIEHFQKENPALIKDLFTVKTKTTVKSEISDYSSELTTDQSYFEVKIFGFKSLDNYLTDYLTPKPFNSYKITDNRIENVLITESFVELPKIMLFHTFRIQFNSNSIQKSKDKFEFPSELNMTNYFHPQNLNQNLKYKLFGVISHLGNASGGHYRIFLKTKDNRWIIFDDRRVEYVDEYCAIQKNYEGNESSSILIYVSEEYWSKLFEEIKESEIPINIKNSYKEEKRKIEAEEDEQNKLYLTLIRHNSFEQLSERGLLITNKAEKIRASSTDQIQDLIRSVSKTINCPPDGFRIWNCSENIPRSLLRKDNIKATIQNLHADTLYVEHIDKNNHIQNFTEEYILIINKFYDFNKIFLLYDTNANRKSEVRSLIPSLVKYLGFPDNTNLLVYEETKIGVRKIDLDKTFDEQKIFSGSLLIFQLEPTENDLLDIPTNPCDSSFYFQEEKTKTVQNYIDRKYFMKKIKFSSKEECKELSFPISLNIDDLRMFVAKAFGLSFNNELDRMFFFTTDNYDCIEAEKTDEFKDNQIYGFKVFQKLVTNDQKPVVYFYFEGSKCMNTDVVLLPISTKTEILTSFCKNQHFNQISNRNFDNRQENSKFDIHNYRIYSIAAGSIIDEITETKPLGQNTKHIMIYIENDSTIIKNTSTERIIMVKYMNNQGRSVKSPFFFKIIKGEQFCNTYERLKSFIFDIEGYTFLLKNIRFEKHIKFEDEIFNMIQYDEHSKNNENIFENNDTLIAKRRE
ncbi:hypothetical protein TRFO_42717 [Tritrichomonas foetus]|uniref:USP domain-containing protein n=1 Tax=Tritrichomonas foetus TaxID=1144522 RepID=A0A1J4KZE5_9EUKA|nr:hypothetical protein TRFO_42717 [Tritrichomonas foetus]|eukprot:OHT15060.1 hypothetical protein TRFO_42717 [Tritrichomonas foetus]